MTFTVCHLNLGLGVAVNLVGQHVGQPDDVALGDGVRGPEDAQVHRPPASSLVNLKHQHCP